MGTGQTPNTAHVNKVETTLREKGLLAHTGLGIKAVAKTTCSENSFLQEKHKLILNNSFLGDPESGSHLGR